MESSAQLFTLPHGATIGGLYVVEGEPKRGGSSQVYKVRQSNLGIERAIKLLQPIPGGPKIEFSKVFREEVGNLLKLTHANIVKILDHGIYRDQDQEHPFIVMEYADGGRLADHMGTVKTLDQLIQIFAQIFDALDYAHERNVMHADIKPDNILCQTTGSNGKLEVKVADLGVGKLISESDPNSASESTSVSATYLYGTRNYAAPEIRYRMNSTAEPIPQDWLQANFKRCDLYSLGVTLAELMSRHKLQGDAHKQSIEQLLGDPRDNIASLADSDREYLSRFVQKLTELEPTKRYQTAAEARSALLRIAPKHLAFGALPELTGVGCSNEIAHRGRLIRFSDRAFRWLHHPVVQRLNKLNQLGYLFYVYPGAHHSRFAHSLEVFETARAATLQLLNVHEFRFLLNEDDISAFLAAALLHDVGHYPLAHIMEEARHLKESAAGDPPGTPIVKRDTNLVRRFLQEKLGEEQSLWDMLKQEGINPERLVNLVSSSPATTPQDRVIKALLDGPIDVDKIAYLRHDSSATSVNYGLGIDLDGLLTSLVIILPDGSPTSAELGLLRRGISPAESVLLARYHMFDRVYWHRTNRAIMAQINYAVSALASFDTVSGEFFSTFLAATQTKSDWEAMVWLSDRMVGAIEAEKFGGRKFPVGNSLAGLANSTRGIYRRLITFAWSPNDTPLSEIHDFFSQDKGNDTESARQAVLDIVAQYFSDVSDHEVLIDVPRKNVENEAKLKNLKIVEDHDERRITPFSNYSKVAEAIVGQYQRIANRSRVFVSQRIGDKCASDRRLGGLIVTAIKSELALLASNSTQRD